MVLGAVVGDGVFDPERTVARIQDAEQPMTESALG